MPKVRLNSPLQRKGWVKEGLIQAKEVSFWSQFAGNSFKSIVYQVNDESCSTGHTTVFDFNGMLTGKMYRGDDYEYGKGEVKRKFSDTVIVDQFELVTNNGSEFDGCDVDDLEHTRHGKSREELSDLWHRQKDQAIFDALQGGFGQNPSHIFDVGTTFDYDTIVNLDKVAKTGKGLKKSNATGAVSTDAATRRAPLKGWTTSDGRKIYLAVIDEYMASKLKSDAKYQTVVINADIRGNGNRAISMVVGKIGNTYFVESPVFFGTTLGEGAFTMADTEIEYAGLRQYAIDSTGNKLYWEGQVGFKDIYDRLEAGNSAGSEAVYSRGLLLGAGAAQFAMGKRPDYKLLEAQNKLSTESMLVWWGNTQKTVLKKEQGSKYVGAVSDVDFSVIAIDMKHEF